MPHEAQAARKRRPLRRVKFRSHPLAGVQGRVPASAIQSQEAARGWTCNLSVVGHYASSGGCKVWRYADRHGHVCAFYDTTLLYPMDALSLTVTRARSPDGRTFWVTGGGEGIAAVDVSDPKNPHTVWVLGRAARYGRVARCVALDGEARQAAPAARRVAPPLTRPELSRRRSALKSVSFPKETMNPASDLDRVPSPPEGGGIGPDGSRLRTSRGASDATSKGEDGHMQRKPSRYTTRHASSREMFVSARSAMAAIVAVAIVLLAAGAAHAGQYPVVYNFPAALAESVVYPTPPGANIWSCHPTSRHPDPVVLVPGLTGSSARDWQAAAPLLANNGYCVFTYDFSSQGDEAIEPAAGGLSSFVDRVLAATGTSKADLVSHSEGGVIARYYIGFLGGAAKTNDLVQISPLNHGTTTYGIAPVLQQSGIASSAISSTCPPCAEQAAGSPFMQKLNGNGDTVPGVSYTVIGTRYDEIITPYQSQFLSGPNVTNILLQDQCSLDAVDHLASQYDSISLRDMLNGLDPAQARPIDCHPVLPAVGG